MWSQAIRLNCSYPQEPVDAYAPPLQSPLAALGLVVSSLLTGAVAPAAGITPPSKLPTRR
jgi:hypothetical protein